MRDLVFNSERGEALRDLGSPPEEVVESGDRDLRFWWRAVTVLVGSGVLVERGSDLGFRWRAATADPFRPFAGRIYFFRFVC